MMKKINIINNEIKIDIENSLTSLFNDEIQNISIDCFCPSRVVSILNCMGANVDEDFDTNGWQYDYWIKFTFKDRRYQVSGSGYYGNMVISESE
jgi:hypothetical protein